MKTIAVYTILLGIAVAGCRDKPEMLPPNILFIIADDVSWDDIGAYGHPVVRTPNIDRLAREGMLFDNFFLTASSCSPSRTSILTGRYPHNTGAAELHTPLPPHLTYFPEALRKTGYFSALAGKWHEGPDTRRAYDTLLVNRAANGEGGEAQWLSLLRNRPKDRPFFFWLAAYDAHRNWSADSAFTQPYDPTEVVVPPTLVDDEATRRDLASYYNEITRLDRYVGLLLEELERQRVAENTLIVFTSDNPRAFPGHKTRVLDRGIKTPFVVRWPRGIQAPGGSRSAALVSSIDIAPTLLGLAGADIAESMQGRSFAKLLQAPDAPFRRFVFAEHNWHDYEAYERSVRTESFLYVRNLRPQFTNEGPIDANQSPSARSLRKALTEGSLTPYQQEVFLSPRPGEEFYDHRKDPAQTRNLIGEEAYRKEIEEMRAVLAQWQEETGDTVPDSLTGDWYDRQDGSVLKAKGIRGEMPGARKGATHIDAKGPF